MTPDWAAVIIAVFALIVAIAGAEFARRSANAAGGALTEAKRANDIAEARDARDITPELNFELTYISDTPDEEDTGAQWTVRNVGADLIGGIFITRAGDRQLSRNDHVNIRRGGEVYEPFRIPNDLFTQSPDGSHVPSVPLRIEWRTANADDSTTVTIFDAGGD